MQHLLLQLKRHIESVYEENRYYKYNICCYSLKDTLNPFMKKINIPNATFVVKVTVKRHIESVHEGNKHYKYNICCYN